MPNHLSFKPRNDAKVAFQRAHNTLSLNHLKRAYQIINHVYDTRGSNALSQLAIAKHIRQCFISARYAHDEGLPFEHKLPDPMDVEVLIAMKSDNALPSADYNIVLKLGLHDALLIDTTSHEPTVNAYQFDNTEDSLNRVAPSKADHLPSTTRKALRSSTASLKPPSTKKQVVRTFDVKEGIPSSPEYSSESSTESIPSEWPPSKADHMPSTTRRALRSSTTSLKPPSTNKQVERSFDVIEEIPSSSESSSESLHSEWSPSKEHPHSPYTNLSPNLRQLADISHEVTDVDEEVKVPERPKIAHNYITSLPEQPKLVHHDLFNVQLPLANANDLLQACSKLHPQPDIDEDAPQEESIATIFNYIMSKQDALFTASITEVNRYNVGLRRVVTDINDHIKNKNRESAKLMAELHGAVDKLGAHCRSASTPNKKRRHLSQEEDSPSKAAKATVHASAGRSSILKRLLQPIHKNDA